MKYYVCGFMFSEDFHEVVLIRKQKPDWQRGKLNGIGGKVEPGEPFLDAMVREFFEETGVQTHSAQWLHYSDLKGSDFHVDFFACIGDIHKCRTTTDEEVKFQIVGHLTSLRTDVIENIAWLVNLAIDCLQDGRPTFAKITY